MVTEVTAFPGRTITAASFTDITNVAVSEVKDPYPGQGDITVVFVSDIPVAQAKAVRRRIRTNNDEEQFEIQLNKAFNAINNFLETQSPSNAAILAYVKLLGRVVKALIKRQIPDLDDDPNPNA